MRENSFPLDAYAAKRLGLERLTPSALERAVKSRLRAAVEYARQTPFYRELYEGLDTGRFHTLPVVSAQDLAERGSAMLAVEQEAVARLFTSGTTGAAKRLHFTAGELAATEDYFYHGSLHFMGKGRRALLLYPCKAPQGPGRLFMAALARMGAEAVPFGQPASPVGGAQALLRERPDLVLCTPNTALELMAAVPKTRLETLLLSGEAISRENIAKLEAHFSCRVFLQYGLTESCFGLGVECAGHCGYHLRAMDYYVEILDEKNSPLPQGEYGRVAVTSLLRGAQPLIRYDTGDISRMLPPCGCKSALPLMDMVYPRPEAKGYRGD